MDMNEILIEDRKYISSKRAAEITGYAKDYIGQLCREGRVPARLIGRSWYVLETAIHDHRFGEQRIETEDSSQTISPASALQATWESPRYESSQVEAFPPHKTNEYAPADMQAQDEVSRNLQDSWRAWFDGATDRETGSPDIHEEDEEKEGINDGSEVIKGVEEEVNIPIHVLHGQPPKELLPRRHIEVEFPIPNKKDGSEEIREKKETGEVLKAARIFGALLAIGSVILAIINTGYFDNYLIPFHSRNYIF